VLLHRDRKEEMKTRKKLYAETLAIESLNENQVEAMFQIFSKYYNNTDKEQFLKDLYDKSRVFLLLDKATNTIQGFSTIKNIDVEFNSKVVRGVFSGDTIIEKEYWGQGTLGVAFLKHLFWEKLKKPFDPLYWFLISKGYKTYLLMANNFSNHYPRFEKATPEMEQHLIDSFSSSLYGHYYDKEAGVISYSKVEVSTKDCLREEVSPITDELINSNKRIRFFAKMNPSWQQGDELSCVAKMTFSMPILYQIKFIRKSVVRFSARIIKRYGSGIVSLLSRKESL
jgi:hypothetical protein